MTPLAASQPFVPPAEGSVPPAALRFQQLVASPLRAGLLRHLHARRDETFEIETLMATMGCLRGDAERCLDALVGAGVARRWHAGTVRYGAAHPANPTVGRLLLDFLATPGADGERVDPPSIRKLLELVGRDEKMLLVLESIRMAAKTDISVLVLGPTGAGKEVVARAIHDLSRRQAQAFQAFSCAAVPDTLFEAEVFGHERGAFTGAHQRRLGRVELANRGTLFLDEIGDLPILSQVKLLRVLEERQVERLGGRRGIDVDFRLISATNRPLEALVAERRFREDLYYRINAFTIRLPALRERPSDIPLLATLFLRKHCTAEGLPPDERRFSLGALDRLSSHAWPGNIRELIATVSRAALSTDQPVIDTGHINFLPLHTSSEEVPVERGVRPLADVERDHIGAALASTGWNKKETARLLGISRETLYRKIRGYRLTEEGPQHR